MHWIMVISVYNIEGMLIKYAYDTNFFGVATVVEGRVRMIILSGWKMNFNRD